MKTLGVIANCDKERARDVLQCIVARAAEIGLAVLADEASAALVPGLEGRPAPEMVESVDAVMALGGDGTMLRTVRTLGGRDKPVIGVNIGGLGFLTSVAEDELEKALDCLYRDDYLVSSRAILAACVVRDGEQSGIYHGVNEVVVGRGPLSRIVRLAVHIDDEPVTTYLCDGLIVSTPAGSTGHSLSAGGPILSPETQAFVISVICPHALSSRPLVIADRSVITVKAEEDPGELVLSIDGQVGQPLADTDTVCIRKAAHGVRFIHLPGHSNFAVLRQKLRWSGSNT